MCVCVCVCVCDMCMCVCVCVCVYLSLSACVNVGVWGGTPVGLSSKQVERADGSASVKVSSRKIKGEIYICARTTTATIRQVSNGEHKEQDPILRTEIHLRLLMSACVCLRKLIIIIFASK